MKWLIMLAVVSFLSLDSIGQDECEKFQILSVYDFPPSPQTPGGNYILLLLTVNQDLATNFDPFYSDLFFVDETGDTITIPLGLSQNLPSLVTDTIPYIMKLNSEMNNQDFPENFRGELIIRTLTSPPFPPISQCNISFSKGTTGLTELMDDKSLLNIYPNPFKDQVHLESEELIDQIRIYSQTGQLIYANEPLAKRKLINLEGVKSKMSIVYVKFKNGKTTFRKIIKSD